MSSSYKEREERAYPEEKELKYIDEPEQKELYELLAYFTNKLIALFRELRVYEKIEEDFEHLHSIVLQKHKTTAQYRLYAVFRGDQYLDPTKSTAREREKAEKKVSLKTAGTRLNEEDREQLVDKFKEIKAIFSSLRGVSQAINALS